MPDEIGVRGFCQNRWRPLTPQPSSLRALYRLKPPGHEELTNVILKYTKKKKPSLQYIDNSQNVLDLQYLERQKIFPNQPCDALLGHQKDS